jgi:hypothetical protein
MAAELVVTPEEYRGDLRLPIHPGRLWTIITFMAMAVIFTLAVLIDLLWKRIRGAAPSHLETASGKP